MDILEKIWNDAPRREFERTMGTELHAVYDAVLKEDLSPRLRQLLRRLDGGSEPPQGYGGSEPPQG